MTNFSLKSALIVALVSASAHAQLAVPRLHSLFPTGAKQGATLDVEIQGDDLDDLTRLYFTHPALKAEKLPDEKDKPANRFRITVPGDVPVGYYDVRVVGRHGISNPRTFVVGDLDEVNEVEPNNTRDKANRVGLEHVINGRVSGGEDVDWFVFAAKKGQRVVVECFGTRIDSKLDGFMSLVDAAGKELAVSQDEPIRSDKRDPMIDAVIPADGDYSVRLTDFMYEASANHFYRLAITTRPYIDFIEPRAIAPGAEAPITFYGRNLPGGQPTDLVVNGHALEKVTQNVKAPDGDPADILRIDDAVRPPATRSDGFGVRFQNSNPLLMQFSRVTELVESGPHNTPQTAMRLTPPCGVTARFDKGDSDYYVISAKKDEKFSIDVYAERINSPADPELELYNPKGEVKSSVSDNGENIGQIRFTSHTRDFEHYFNADDPGDYVLRVEHLFRQVQGGPQFSYRLVVQRDKQPDFRIVCAPPHDNHLDAHCVRQGGRERIDVLVWRNGGLNEPITVEAKNLPPGVTAEPIVVGPNVKWGTLVLTAAADAPIGEADIEVVGTAKIGEQTPVRKARGGSMTWDTNNTSAMARMNRSLPIAVRPGAPFELTAAPSRFTVTQGEPIEFGVQVRRAAEMTNAIQLNGAGYEKPQNLNFSNVDLAPTQTDGKIKIETAQLQPGTYSIIVNGDGQFPVKDKNGKEQNRRCVYPSNPITITINAAPKK
jgi:hypothetical protein